jgi:hypothetical protein
MTDVNDLKQTAITVGELVPVLVNKKGIVIDGRHRQQVNPGWLTREVDLDDLKTHAARLVVNTQRRTAGKEDYEEFAKYLRETEPGDKKYKVKSGETIAERISTLSGINLRTVQRHLEGTEFVGPQHPGKHDGLSSSSRGAPRKIRHFGHFVKQLKPKTQVDEHQLDKLRAAGQKQGYTTTPCPSCRAPLWSKGSIVLAKI